MFEKYSFWKYCSHNGHVEKTQRMQSARNFFLLYSTEINVIARSDSFMEACTTELPDGLCLLAMGKKYGI